MGISSNKKLLIQIADSFINIIIGNKKKIHETHSIPLQTGICNDGSIINKDEIIRKLKEYLDISGCDTKKVSFILRGTDIISRNIEVPILDEDALREAVYFEFNQFIPEVDKYYTDYEIVKTINNKEKKAHKMLLVAAPKAKIRPYVEIAEAIEKELEVIDILSNSVARTLVNSSNVNNKESTAVLYLGTANGTLSIIEDKVLKFERNLPFGINNIFNDAYMEAAATVTAINSKEILRVVEQEVSKKSSFENMITSINNTIRYYNSERVNKPVGNFIIICADIMLDNFEKHLEKYLDIPCILVREPADLELKVKFEENFSKFIADYGILLRGGKNKLLNLNPKAINKELVKGNLDKTLVKVVAITLVSVTVVTLPFSIVNKSISKEISAIKEDINLYSEIIEKNKMLKETNLTMEKFVNGISSIENNTLKTSTILAKVNTHLPNDVEFVTLSFVENGVINISGESRRYEAISEFLANLQMSEEFSNAKISYINQIEKVVASNEERRITANNISTVSNMPLAMVGSFNLFNNTKEIASETNKGNVGKGNNINNDNESINSSNTNIESNDNQDSNETTNSGTSDTETNTNLNTDTKKVKMYSFAISIEGVNSNDNDETR